jgi:hypothetical protein
MRVRRRPVPSPRPATERQDASHGQLVRIVTVDGDAIQIELLEGLEAGHRAWLKARNLAPLH